MFEEDKADNKKMVRRVYSLLRLEGEDRALKW